VAMSRGRRRRPTSSSSSRRRHAQLGVGRQVVVQPRPVDSARYAEVRRDIAAAEWLYDWLAARCCIQSRTKGRATVVRIGVAADYFNAGRERSKDDEGRELRATSGGFRRVQDRWAPCASVGAHYFHYRDAS
jgi:hypothetical protein